MKSTLTVMLGFFLLITVAVMLWPKLEEKPKTFKHQTSEFATKSRARRVVAEKEEPVTFRFNLRAKFDKPEENQNQN